jgi:hypothetical protein
MLKCKQTFNVNSVKVLFDRYKSGQKVSIKLKLVLHKNLGTFFVTGKKMENTNFLFAIAVMFALSDICSHS